MNLAEQRAKEIRQKYNPENLVPFPHQKVIDDIEELYVSFNSLNEKLSRVYGATYYDDESEQRRFVIVVNTAKSEAQQNFSFAHGLGHYLLHKERIVTEEIIVDSEEDKGGEIEVEADDFATELLMPEEKVSKAWKDLKGDSEECAKVFNVPFLVMSKRLVKLGIIKE